jgi:hypothetical protein
MNWRPASDDAVVSIFASGSEVEIAMAAKRDARSQRPPDARRLRAQHGPVPRSPPTCRTRSSARPRSMSPSKPASARAGTAIIGRDGIFIGMDVVRRIRPL